MKKTQYGFTLLELMVVLSLCLILIGGGAVIARSLQKTAIVAEMNLLCTACNYLQQQAIATNSMQELTFDCQNNKYTFNGHEHTLAQNVCFGVPAHVYGPPSAPHKQLHEPITFAQNSIMFYPEGTMSAGMVCFTDAHHKVLYAISSAVAHVSFLRRYYYDGKWHAIT